MPWDWLWSPWVSAGMAIGTIALSIATFLLTGMIFVFFVLPIPIVFWSLRKKNA
jgi:hypothetical protein